LREFKGIWSFQNNFHLDEESVEFGGEGGLDEGKALKYLVDINEIVEQLLDVVIELRIIA
jgi:hypothetical protein